MCLLLSARTARADYAAPPESPYRGEEPRPEPVRWAEREPGWAAEPSGTASSTFRFQVGPALLLQPVSPGLLTALDIGKGAVGARVSAAWLRAESERGLAAYSAELWIDFRHRSELHPILGAGASLLRGGALGQEGSAGAGSLRGALEYELPIADADARLSLALTGFVPAIGIDRTRPWLACGLTVGVGF